MTWWPLLRRQLPVASGVTWVLAALVALACLLAVAAPRAAATARADALTHRLEVAAPVQRDLTVTATPSRYANVPFNPAMVATTARELTEQLRPAAARLFADPVYSAFTQPVRARTLPGGGLFEGEPARLGLRLQTGWAEHVDVVEGRLPERVAASTDVDPGLLGSAETNPVALLEVALTRAVAEELGVGTGQELLLSGALVTPPLVARVVGIVEPHDPAGAEWATARLAVAPQKVPSGDGGQVWIATALLADDPRELVRALGSGVTGVGPGAVSPGMTNEWRFVLDIPAVRPADAGVLAAAVGRVLSPAEAPAPFPSRATTGLPGLLEEQARAVAVTDTLVSVLGAGLLTLAGLGLVLTTAVLVDRRRGELTLLRRRGASLRQLVGLAGGHLLVRVVPAAVVGTAAGLLLVPRGPVAGPLLAALLVTVVPLLVLPVLVRGLGARERVRRPLTRLAAEAALVLLAVLGVLGLRRRGLPAEGGIDPLAAGVPTLVVLVVAVLVLRVYPPLVVRAAHVLGRGRAAVGFLGLARAARERGTTLPLAVLLLATALCAFTLAVSSTAQREQDAAAWRAAGTDVVVTDPAGVTGADVAALAGVSGVGAALPAYLDDDATLAPDGADVTVLGVDVPAYAGLLAGTPLESDALDRLAAAPPAGADGPLPALLPAPLPGEPPLTEELSVSTSARRFALDVVGTVPGLRRGARADVPVVLVRADDLATATNGALADDAVLLRAADEPEGTWARRVEGALGPSQTRDVVVRTELLAAVADSPLPVFLTTAAATTVLASAGFAVAAVGLMLALGAGDRLAGIARLRTMGLRPRQVRALVAVELAPLAVAALVPGVAAGLALPWLLGPGLDLSPVTGGPADPVLRAEPAAVAALAAGLVLAVAAGAVVDAARDARANLSATLRIGDR